MSRKANPTMIGAFVVGAVVIAVAAAFLLTGGRLFQEKLSLVMHFVGSVKGLNAGAPVSYRGVQIGTVTNIKIVLEPDQDPRIPVTVQIDPSSFTIVGMDKNLNLDELREGIYAECKNEGLRAQLQMQSLLTGQLFIQLDYFPDSKADFVEGGDVAEIPTIPTALQDLSSMLQDFPVKEVLANVEKAVASLAELTSDEGIHEALDSVDQAFTDVSKLVTNLDSRTQALQPALVEGRRTLAQATRTLASAEQTFVEATETLAPMKNLVADDSELLELIDEVLAAMINAAQAFAALADTLERRPEAILKGKGALGGD